MDSPICSKRNSSGARIEIYRRFGRFLAPDGNITMEFAAQHIRAPIDRARWPVPLPPNIPPDAIAIDRYGNYKPGRGTPHGITDPELIAAIHAMTPVDVSHLQNDDNGCGAAVVAILTGQSYADAIEELHKGHGVRMLGTQRLATATGTTCKWGNGATLADAIDAGAVAALIKRDGAKWGHYVAINFDAIITDPELVLRYPFAVYPRRNWQALAYFVPA